MYSILRFCKTTLLRCILGLLKFTEGEARFDGKAVSQWKPRDFWRTIRDYQSASEAPRLCIDDTR